MEKIELGVIATVTGIVRPWGPFIDKDTGEIRSGLNVEVPGGKVSVPVSDDVVVQFNDGDTWRITGVLTHNKNGIKIARVTEAKKLTVSETAANTADVFGFGAKKSK